ncbi:MAG: hypothetical protein M1838_000864 [Thelocarpon superellum]|nr:MAG: hypothetical protein M1838_000864 [Thelocarpon superellum]
MAVIGEKRGYVTQFYPPVGSGRESEVDIVAVHGLGTESPTTWIAYDDSQKDGIEGSPSAPDPGRRYVNWLGDENMLPNKVPTARILSFNYDSSWYFHAPAQRLLPLAETLLTTLSDFRKKASAASRDTLTRDLEGNNGVLEDLHHRFSTLARELGLELRFFYEMQPTAIFPAWGIISRYTEVLLVDQISACIDTYQRWGLNVRHCMMNKFADPQDGNYELVAGRVLDLAQNLTKIMAARRKEVVYTYLPLERNEDVVIRGSLFKQLNVHLPLGNQRQAAALWGLGGSGVASFTRDYEGIAKNVGLSLEIKGEELLDSVRLWLEQQSSYLLVLDNADVLNIFRGHSTAGNPNPGPIELSRFVPQGSTGSILWTSRDSQIVGNWVSAQKGVEVGKMEPAEALDLLRCLSCSTLTGEASCAEMDLIDELHKLPLAVAQAAASIRTTGISVGAYVKRLGSEEKWIKSLDRDFVDRYRRSDVPNSVLRTWLISMDQIAAENALAKKIFTTIVFFDRQGIPFELLRAAAGLELDDDDDDNDEDEALQAATRLKEFSFLKVMAQELGDMPQYELHPLVQKATRLSLDKSTRAEHVNAAAQIMGKVFPSGEYGSWEKCRLFVPHATTALAWLKGVKQKIRHLNLTVNVARYFYEQGRSTEAEKLGFQVLELRKGVLGERHPDTLDSMDDLASTYHQQGRSKEAEELHAQALELPNLAATYRQQGRLKEAEELEVQVLELRKDILEERHPDTLRSMANLAATYHQQGRSTEAEELHVQVLELRKDMLEEKHPEMLRSMANLAATYHQQGRSSEAEELHVQVLELRKDVLGQAHPDTLTSMANLSATYRQQGRSTEAEELLVQVLELRKNVLGERHPDTLRSVANLAAAYRQQGHLKEAEELHAQALELRKDVQGKRHPNTLRSMSNLAVTYLQQGRSKEAEELHVQALELRKDVLGERHSSTLRSMANLAMTYWQQGRSKEAEELHVQALELRKDVLGERHPNTLASRAHLAATYRQQGRLKEAEQLEAQELELRKESRTPSLPRP